MHYYFGPLMHLLSGVDSPAWDLRRHRVAGNLTLRLRRLNSGVPVGGTAMDRSDWQELARLTARLDELSVQLGEAEADSKIAMIYALEEEIAATEEMRAQVFNRLHDRVTEEAAA